MRVRLHLDPDNWHGATSEGLWSKLIAHGNEKSVVMIDNIPFFSKNICLGDTISVTLINREWTFNSVVERGGHSTYRIFFSTDKPESLSRLKILKEMGCDWEFTAFNGGSRYAIDIPPTTDINVAYSCLEAGFAEEVWLFEEGFVGHPLLEM